MGKSHACSHSQKQRCHSAQTGPQKIWTARSIMSRIHYVFKKCRTVFLFFFCVSICQFIYNLLFSTDLCFHCTIKINCLVTSPPTVTFVIIILFLNLQTSSLSPCLPLHLSDFTLPPFSKTLEDNHLLPLPIRIQWQISELLDLFIYLFFWMIIRPN